MSLLRRHFLVKLASASGKNPLARDLEFGIEPSQRAHAERIIRSIEHLDPSAEIDIQQRALIVSKQLLGRPFFFNPIGEGKGTFDPDPFFSLESFDCLTFCETVIAIARARSIEAMVEELLQLRYKEGQFSFAARRHFPSIEWMPAAVQAGTLVPLVGANDAYFDVEIRQKAWLANLAKNPMYAHLLSRGANPFPVVDGSQQGGEVLRTRLRYLPIARPLQCERATKVLVVGLVRPNSPLSAQAGGGEVISHMGMAIRAEAGDKWMFRAASDLFGSVIDTPLESILFRRSKHPTVGGMYFKLAPKQLALPADSTDSSS